MLHRNSYVATWKFQFCQFVVESCPLVVEFVRVTEVVVEIVETERTEPAIRLVVRFQPQRNNPLLCIECVLSLCPDHTSSFNRDSSLASSFFKPSEKRALTVTSLKSCIKMRVIYSEPCAQRLRPIPSAALRFLKIAILAKIRITID